MLKIVPVGELKEQFPRGLKSGWTVEDNHIPTALTSLNQFMDWDGYRVLHKWKVYAGTSWGKKRRLTKGEIQLKRFGGATTIWLEPSLEGDDPATLTAMAIQAAITVASMVIQAALAPKKSDGKNITGVTFDGGLNTSVCNAPFAYIGGLKVMVGSQNIEAAIKTLRNPGGSSSFEGEDEGSLPTGGGSGGGGGDGSNPNVNPWEDWVDSGRGIDDLIRTLLFGGASGGAPRNGPNQNITYAQMKALFCPGGGRTDGPYGATIQEKEKNIFIDRVPLRDHGTGEYTKKGVRWTYRRGEQGQLNVGMLPGIASPHDKADGTLVYNVPNPTNVEMIDADYVEALVNCRLIFTGRDGKEHPDTMELKIETKRNNASTWNVLSPWSITTKNDAGFDSDLLIPAPPKTEDPEEGWTFRLTRTIDEGDNDRHIREATLKAWTEYRNIDLTYDGFDADGNRIHPSAALFGITVEAVDDGSGKFPEIALLWSGREVRVPTNYDPVAHTYTGLWNGSWKWAATENPVWLWLDMMTATDGMGLGIDINTRFNKYKLYAQAQYCDQMVDGKPRWTCNKQWADDSGFQDHIMEFCKSFRAVPYYDGTEYYLAMDMPGMPVQHFVNNDMVEGGLFDFTTSEAESRFNVVNVEYDDPLKFYEKSGTTWSDEEDIAGNAADKAGNGGIVEFTGYKQGCTSEAEAQRFAYEIGWCSLNEVEAVTFKTTMQAADYRPGDRIEIQDWVNNGQAPLGRVHSVLDANTFVLPIDFTFEADTAYKLYAQVGQTRIVRDLPIYDDDTTTRNIALTAHGLVEDAPIGIVESNGVQLWNGIIRSIEQEDAGEYTVSCQQWIEEKFSVFAGYEVTVPPTLPSIVRGIGSISGLAGRLTHHTDPLRGSIRTVELNWSPPAEGQAVCYLLKHLAPSYTNWRLIDSPTMTFEQVELLESGQHRFTVEAVNMLGDKSTPVQVMVDTEDQSHAFVPPLFHAVH